MKSNLTAILLMSLLSLSSSAARAEQTVVDLAGTWHFALDPLGRGEATGWHGPDEGWTGDPPAAASGWDKVEVPHCWSVDPRYEHTGKAWYRRSVHLAAHDPALRYRMEFDAAFYRTRVWINGRFVGEHEGGYTPFAFDVTSHLLPGRGNLVAVEVDNSWSQHTLPGARPGNSPDRQLYPWWNYGGITRPARIVAHPAVHVVNQKVDAAPDLAAGGAEVRVTAFVRNDGGEARRVRVEAKLTGPSGAAAGTTLTRVADVPAGTTQPVTLSTRLPPADVERWHVHRPRLYTSAVTAWPSDPAGSDAPGSAHSARFGIRSIEARDGRLLLNGEPVRLAGANRIMDHPRFGATEPDALVETDLRLLKDAHLELARLQHYPLAGNLLDRADEYGLLIIGEAASWGFPAAHLADPVIREKFRAQMREMLESSWNHPSVIGWSVGNEYESWTPEGVQWTKDMKAFVRSHDDTRPVVFVALGMECKKVIEAIAQGSPGREAFSSHYSDILCPNVYAGPDDAAKWLDALHQLWPDKPVLITEYGKRTDQVKDEADRVRHFEQMLGVVRARDYVCGLSYWSFNDYRSRYPGTNANGYRPWGLVDAERRPRALHAAMRSALAPAAVRVVEVRDEGEDRIVVLEVKGRSDFPSLTIPAARARLISDDGGRALAEQPLGPLRPGVATRTELRVGASAPTGRARVQVLAEDGRVLAEAEVETP